MKKRLLSGLLVVTMVAGLVAETNLANAASNIGSSEELVASDGDAIEVASADAAVIGDKTTVDGSDTSDENANESVDEDDGLDLDQYALTDEEEELAEEAEDLTFDEEEDANPEDITVITDDGEEVSLEGTVVEQNDYRTVLCVEDVPEECMYNPDDTATGDTVYTYMPESSSGYWSSFSNYYYYNNGLLNSREKKLYKALYKMCYSYLTGKKNLGSYTSYVSNYGCSKNEQIQTTWIFISSNPQFYFLQGSYSYGSGVSIGIYSDFRNGSKRAKCTAQLKNKILAVYMEAKAEASGSGYTSGSKGYNYVLESSIAEQVCETITYKYNLIDPDNGEYTDMRSQSCYYGLIKNWGVCTSYGKSFELLINGLDISKMYVAPVTGCSHFWDEIYLNGTWYVVDCTWADTGGKNLYFYGSINYNVSQSIVNRMGGRSPESYFYRGGKAYYPKYSSSYTYNNEDRAYIPSITVSGSSVTVKPPTGFYETFYLTSDGTDPQGSDTAVNSGSSYLSSYTFTDVSAGTVQVRGNYGYSNYSRIVAFDNAISNLKVTSGSSSITLSWTKARRATSYVVQRLSADGTTWSTIGTTSSCSYTDKGLSSKTLYQYRVAPKYDSPRLTGTGIYVSGSFTTGVAGAGTLKLTSAGDTSVSMTWTAISGTEGYQIYRSTSKDKGYSLAKTLTGDELTAATNGTTVSYTDTVSAGVTYYYKVRGYYTNESAENTNHLGCGDFSSIITAVMKPAKISTFTQSASSTSSMNFTWKKVTGAAKYQIYRASSSTGKYSLLATVASNGKATLAKGVKGSCSLKSSTYTFKNTGLGTGKTYYYKVRAIRVVSKKSYYGSYSDVIAGVTRPGVAGNFKWKTSNSDSVTLTWTKASGASGYYVYQSTDNKTFTQVAAVLANGNCTPADGVTGSSSLSGSTYSYKSAGLGTNVKRYYKVIAYCKGSKTYNGTATSVVSAMSGPEATSVTYTATSLSKQGTAGSNTATIYWSAVSNSSGYQVYRSTDNKTFTKIATVAKSDGKATPVSGYSVSGKINADGSYNFTNKNLKSTDHYYYRVYTYRTVSGRTLCSTAATSGSLCLNEIYVSACTETGSGQYGAGSDSAGSGTLTHPYATIQHALDRAKAGQTVYVRGNSSANNAFMPCVYSERLTFSYSGSSSNYITLSAYGDELVDIEAPDDSHDPLVNLKDCSYIKICNLKFGYTGLSSQPECILYAKSGNHIEVKDNLLVGNSSSANRAGIYLVDVSDSAISGNDIEGLYYGVAIESEGTASSNNIKIQGNRFLLNLVSAVKIGSDGSSYAPSGITVSGNKFIDNYGATTTDSGVINLGRCSRVEISSNEFWHNGCAYGKATSTSMDGTAFYAGFPMIYYPATSYSSNGSAAVTFTGNTFYLNGTKDQFTYNFNGLASGFDAFNSSFGNGSNLFKQVDSSGNEVTETE